MLPIVALLLSGGLTAHSFFPLLCFILYQRTCRVIVWQGCIHTSLHLTVNGPGIAYRLVVRSVDKKDRVRTAKEGLRAETELATHIMP